MVVTVRGVSDSRVSKSVGVVCVLVLWGAQVVFAQQKVTTQQEANQRIQQLANVARSQHVDAAVGAGDLLHIDVFDVPELSRDVRVSDTGEISYPLVPGKILAAGLTTFQLESKLEQLLLENGLVSHPQVSVFVKEQISQSVSVVGAVNHPVVYQLIRPTSLLEILAQAGGITDDAGETVIITRQPRHPPPEATGAEPAAAMNNAAMHTSDAPADQPQIITIQLQDLLTSGNPAFNIEVQGGDVISIPRAGIVYVLGAGISQPGGYVMQSHGEQITVLKAVALAHGLSGFAKADSAVILRRNPATGKKDAIPAHIKKIENRKADDVPMQANDILYVPDSAGKKALARGAEAAIGVGTGVAIYRSGSF